METMSGVAAERDVVEAVEADGRQPSARRECTRTEGMLVIVQMVEDGVSELRRQAHGRREERGGRWTLAAHVGEKGYEWRQDIRHVHCAFSNKYVYQRVAEVATLCARTAAQVSL